MAHRLLVPPVRRMEGTARLPLIQHPGRTVARNLLASMRVRDSLRLVKTTGRNIAPGPLPSPQVFVLEGPGYTNSPASMQAGMRVANAPRLVDKTRGADNRGRATAANNATSG